MAGTRPPESSGGRAAAVPPPRPAGFMTIVASAIALLVACSPAAMSAPAPAASGVSAPRAAAPLAPVSLRELLASTPADSLPDALRRFENAHARTPEGTEAMVALARLHYARGAYRAAAEWYARAAARLEPGSKPEARYWSGLAWLALSEPERARAALDEVASAQGPRQAAAMLAQAQLWELAQRPERADEVLGTLLGGDPGEVGPVALERSAALAESQGHLDDARLRRERLLRDYPRSIEAAAARRTAFSPAGARAAGRPRPGASTAVVIGVFEEQARARSLAAAARAAGFADAQVISRGEGLSAVHLVRLGVYPGVAEARKAGAQAGEALGVTFELARAD